jgi:hypothetical protein
MVTRGLRHAGSTLLLVALLVCARSGSADVAATGMFGIDIDVNFPPTSGTFSGAITSFDAGPFSVGGNAVDLQTDIVSMSLAGNLTNINIPALAVTFDFDATDDDLTANDLDFAGAGIAVCDNQVTCFQGQGSFVGDLSGFVDPNDVLPDGFVYTFDGRVFVDPGPFDAAGVFGINGFAPVDVPAGNPVMATSDPTTFFDSRQNTLRDYLVDLTFAEVTNPGTVSFLGKSAVPGALPTNIAVNPDVSIFIDIVTGDGLAFDPPVDVCVHYDDVAPMDGIVDGTDVEVDTLKLLHALALGDNFQDVTTTVGGGVVCGQVGTLSPFVVAVGPPPTTTTTTSTTVSSTTSTSSTTTTLPALLSGKKMLLKDNATKPQKKGVQVVAKDPGVDLGAGPGTPDDPTLSGGTLRIVGNIGSSVGGAFDDTYALPAANWKLLKKNKPEMGYKFKKGDPVKSLQIKADKLISIKAKGAALGHALPVQPDSVGVVVTIGSRTYCLGFGGDQKFKENKKLLAKNASPPSGCPGAAASPSGAFLD